MAAKRSATEPENMKIKQIVTLIVGITSVALSPMTWADARGGAAGGFRGGGFGGGHVGGGGVSARWRGLIRVGLRSRLSPCRTPFLTFFRGTASLHLRCISLA